MSNISLKRKKPPKRYFPTIYWPYVFLLYKIYINTFFRLNAKLFQQIMVFSKSFLITALMMLALHLVHLVVHLFHETVDIALVRFKITGTI